jgi:hypothetical protein
MADSLEWWGRAIDSHWEQDVLGVMYMCFEEGTAVARKNMFKFCIELLVDSKIQQPCASDIPFGLKEDWLHYFDSTLDHSSFFTCTVKSIQYIEKRITEYVIEKQTIVISDTE